MELKRHLPTAATLCNGAAGIAACGFAVNGYWEMAALMIMVAVLLDSLDGALARALGSVTEFGKELDSLADVISFGCAPTVLVGSLMPFEMRDIGWILVTFYPLCAMWRLARFNTRQDAEEIHKGFFGLPSTAAGGAAATAVLLYLRLSGQGVSPNVMVLPWILMVLGALMISGIGYKHAGAVIGKLNPAVAVVAAMLFLGGSIFWQYEYMFAALIWAYALSGPVGAARGMIRAVHHA
ncbi:MAG: CDP-alcohol phosphatidyltransferase family protein [Candidatus Brocadiae bacterium]|nr:CDP-alcohol phosphatidyltransferase family protein [Candidatus Brocadiia bacterium]